MLLGPRFEEHRRERDSERRLPHLPEALSPRRFGARRKRLPSV